MSPLQPAPPTTVRPEHDADGDPTPSPGRAHLAGLFVVHLVLLGWAVLWKLEHPSVGGLLATGLHVASPVRVVHVRDVGPLARLRRPRRSLTGWFATCQACGGGACGTLTVGMPTPDRAMTASDGSRPGFDSRCTVKAGTRT